MKKFGIFFNTRDDNSYFYSYSSYAWAIVSLNTGDELYLFDGSCDTDKSGKIEQGTKAVAINEDETILLITNADNTITEIQLPISVDLSNDGYSIILTWINGKIEKRERKKLLFTTKYGEPYCPYDLKYHKQSD